MAALNKNSINIYFCCLPDMVEERIHEMEKRFGKKKSIHKQIKNMENLENCMRDTHRSGDKNYRRR